MNPNIYEGVKRINLKDNAIPYINMPIYIKRNFHNECQ